VAAQRALLEIGASRPTLFITVLNMEIRNPDVVDEYLGVCIMTLTALIRKNPLTFVRHLSDVVEAVINTLDPSKPLLRKGCLNASTKALHELVRRFSIVAFHQKTQRFAVGTPQKFIIIYDLRTATKWRLLEGHSGSISALCFDDQGKYLSSYSAEELCVKIWLTGSSGFFGGIFGLHAKCIMTKYLHRSNDCVDHLSSITKCRFEWVTSVQLKLRRENGSIVTISW
jgi:hypothetical protein